LFLIVSDCFPFVSLLFPFGKQSETKVKQKKAQAVCAFLAAQRKQKGNNQALRCSNLQIFDLKRGVCAFLAAHRISLYSILKNSMRLVVLGTLWLKKEEADSNLRVEKSSIV